jgi:uncharacterized membrane protein YphA (DoxX/SURF4 family)
MTVLHDAAFSLPYTASAYGATALRAAFAAIMAVSAFQPYQRLGRPLTWRPGTIGARIGSWFVGLPVRGGCALLLVVSGAAFAAGIAVPWTCVVLSTMFLLFAALYLSESYAGYVTEDDDGNRRFHIHHHLHLAGLCAITVPGAGIVAVLTGHGADVQVSTVWLAQGMWGAIAAHYFTSGLAKLRSRGLSWPDRRLLPFYVALIGGYAEGDGERMTRSALRDALLRRPALGSVTLWGALGLELLSPLMLLGPVFRAVVAGSLLLFHIVNWRLLWVDFRENAMLVTLAALPVP